jgi:CheY-like chemotaxis protein
VWQAARSVIAQQRPRLGVVLTSAYVPQGDMLALSNSAVQFIAKPYEPRTVLELIRAQISGAG